MFSRPAFNPVHPEMFEQSMEHFGMKGILHPAREMGVARTVRGAKSWKQSYSSLVGLCMDLDVAQILTEGPSYPLH
jgi:hypothetical protein